MSHYFVEKFFSPTLISAIVVDDRVEVWAVCDQASSSPLSLSTTSHQWRSFSPAASSLQGVPGCPSPGAHLQLSQTLASLLEWGSCSPPSSSQYRLAYCLLTFQLQEEDEEELSSSTLMAPPRLLTDPNYGLQEPALTVTVTGRLNRIMEVGQDHSLHDNRLP